MKNVSTAFKTELNNDRRFYTKSCDITLADGTKLPVNNSHIWDGGFKLEEAVSSSDSFDIGAAIIGKFTLRLNNIYDDFSDYDFTDAVISNVKVGLELPDGTAESVKKGVFTVDEAQYNGSIITLECLDNMSKFDKPYSRSNLIYPAMLGAIVRDACSCCGVKLAADTESFEKDDYVVASRPDDKVTFRQVLSWAAQISCHWCRCNEYGELSFGWYDTAALERLREGYDGGIFAPWDQETKLDGGSMNPWNKGDEADGGSFDGMKGYHHIISMSSMEISTDDVLVTGIRVSEEGDGGSDAIYQSGTDGYVLSVEGNALIQGGKGAEVARYLGSRLIGLQFRPLSVSCLSDPSLEAGDIAVVSDRKGNIYPTLVTNTTFQAGGYQKVSCGAETPARNSAQRPSQGTLLYRELRQRISRQKTEWEKAVDSLGERLDNAGGLYPTEEEREDHSTVYYLHDKPELEGSKVIIKITRQAIGISTDGGKTWPTGVTVDGEAVIKILQAIGVNADWINTGAIVVRDAYGNILFLADITNRRVEMNADVLKIAGRSVEDMIVQEAEDIVGAVAEDLQVQIDGKIQSYSQANDPSMEWAEAAYQDHAGDIWKQGENLFRWDGAKWEVYNGADEAARKLAEKKAQVFSTTPVPPYKSGDMWVTSTEDGKAEYRTCVKDREAGELFASGDWISPKYTDDTAANQALNLLKDKSGNYYGKYVPTLSNAPASEWDAQEYGMHRGDIFLDVRAGDVYTFQASPPQWVKLPKAEAADILEQLDQETVYNALTNDGQDQLMQVVNGRIFFNGERINARTVTSTAIRDGAVTQTKIQGGAVSTEKLASKAVTTDKVESKAITADKVDVDELATLDATVGGFRINDMQIYTDPAQNNVTSLILCSWQNGVYIMMRHKENNSYVEDFYWDKEGLIASESTEVLQLLRHTMLNSDTFMDGSHHSLGSTWFNGPVNIYDDFKVSAGYTKSVERDTRDYGRQDFYCYETPTPSLGDFGMGVVAEDGTCVIDLDDIFRESVNTEIEYYVFLQKEGPGDLWVSEKNDTYFIVKGTPGLRFAYEAKAKQAGLEHIRFRDASRERDVGLREMDYAALLAGDREKIGNEADYEAELENDRESLIREMEEMAL